TRAVGALLGIDRDRERGAHRLAELARDATLLAVRIAAQRVKSAKPIRLRDALHRILDRVLRAQEIAPGHHESLDQLPQHQAPQEIEDALHVRALTRPCSNAGSRRSRLQPTPKPGKSE